MTDVSSENLVHAIARFSDDDECWFFEIAEPGDAHCPDGKRDNDTSVHPQGIVATATLARDAEQHADALWHTLWFHTLNLHTMRRDEIGPHDPDASMFDSDEERQAYNAYQAERDIDAETDHHRRVVAACRDAYRHWGIKLPDDDTVIAHPTYASWRAAPSSTSPTIREDHPPCTS